MRYFVRLIVLAVVLVGVVTAVAMAQPQPAATPPQPAIPIPSELAESAAAPGALIDGIWQPLELERADAALVPQELTTEEPPSDSCSEATPLLISPITPGGGGRADVLNATQSPSDPPLSCLWGRPSSPQGYRTVWYRFTAAENGTVYFNTFDSGYDTVIAVYKVGDSADPEAEPCDLLEAMRCNDDAQGFWSEVTLPVSQGSTYYVELADWQPGIVNTTDLRFSALWLPAESSWYQINTVPQAPAISRHAVIVQDVNLYVIGGQTGEAGLPLVSNRLQRYNTVSEVWQELPPIPGAGYSNTTAAFINGRIYLPSGFNGNSSGYDGLHWVFTMEPNTDRGVWSTAASIPANLLPAGGYFAWSQAVVPPTQNRYFLVGGMSSTIPLAADAQVVGDTYVYFPSSDSWARLVAMQAPRYAHVAGWLGSGYDLCVAGGLGVGSVADEPVAILHRSTECYTPGTGAWRTVADMQIPRFGAGSVVGPDGNWYVFGGITIRNNRLVAVAETEMFNPRLGTWTVLDPRYNLGGTTSLPARYWPRGGIINEELWTVGGSLVLDGEQALPIVQTLDIPSNSVYVPVSTGKFRDAIKPDSTLAEARNIAFGVPQSRNFDAQFDFFDIYYFDLPQERRVNVWLEVPDNANFDLALYGQNKLLWGQSANPFNGDDERIVSTLPPRRYFIVVQRRFPSGMPDPGQVYRVRVTEE